MPPKEDENQNIFKYNKFVKSVEHFDAETTPEYSYKQINVLVVYAQAWLRFEILTFSLLFLVLFCSESDHPTSEASSPSNEPSNTMSNTLLGLFENLHQCS